MFGEIQQKYDFRKELTTPNKSGIASQRREVAESEITLENGIYFVGGIDSQIIEHAKQDFIDFLKVSAEVENPLNSNGVKVEINIGGNLGEFNCYKGRIVTITQDKITINAFDERGVAAAIFDLEILMQRAKAPILKKRTIENKPLFSPRMAHSAYGLDVFPDQYLLKLAKEGVDAILFFVGGINKDERNRYMDINDIITRAASYGLDSYAYCKLTNFMHPDEEGAEQAYYDVYGKFFEAHPGFKGMVFVGESVEFPSKDERVAKRHYYEVPEDNIPDGKLSPGWWPCKDYPQWISLVAKSIRKAKESAEIVFWTYNWGHAPKDKRIELLRALPQDITLLVTFEMCEPFKVGNITEMGCDYSLVQPRAGGYFLSEAEIAKGRNIKLYSQVNTCGRTWDFGILPIEPMLNHWKIRFDEVNACRIKYNLSGLMESHHFGYTPSFITRFSNYCFNYAGDLEEKGSSEKYQETVMKEFFGEDIQALKLGFGYLSKALECAPPTDEQQYGPMRIGTAYPLNLNRNLQPKDKEDSLFGLRICETMYRGLDNQMMKFTIHSVRLYKELKMLKKGAKHVDKAIQIFSAIKDKNDELKKLINLISYIKCMFVTSVNVKEFFIQKHKLYLAPTRRKVRKHIKNIRKIGEREIINAKKSIEFVEKDSSIGFEPSMCYQGDKEHIEWKIKQVRYMLDSELKIFADHVEI